MNPFRFILGLAAFCVVAYVLYFSMQSRDVPKKIDIGSTGSFKSIPATVCRLANSGGTVSGKLYVFHDAARFDIISTLTGSPIGVHLLVTREDTAYYWVDGESTGTKGDYGPVFNNVGLGIITKVNCSPWWFPNGALFIAPQGVTFSR